MPAYERYTHTYTHYIGLTAVGEGGRVRGFTTRKQSGTTTSVILPPDTDNPDLPNTFSGSSSHITPTPTYTTTSVSTDNDTAPNVSVLNYYDSTLTTITKQTTVCSTRTVTTENTTDASTEVYNATYTYEAEQKTYDENALLYNTFTTTGQSSTADTITLSEGYYDTPNGVQDGLVPTTTRVAGSVGSQTTVTFSSLSSDTDLNVVLGAVSYLDSLNYIIGNSSQIFTITYTYAPDTTLTGETITTNTSDGPNIFMTTINNYEDGAYTTLKRYAGGGSETTERAGTRTLYSTRYSDLTRYSSSTSAGTDSLRVPEDGPFVSTVTDTLFRGLNMTVITPILPRCFLGFGFEESAFTKNAYKTTATATAGSSFSQIPTSGIMGELSSKQISPAASVFVTGSCGLPANNSNRTLSWFTDENSPEFATSSRLLATHASTYTSASNLITSTLTSTRGMSISISCKSVINDKADFVDLGILSDIFTETATVGFPIPENIFETYLANLAYNDALAADRTVVFQPGSYTISKTYASGGTAEQVANINQRWFTSIMPDGENWAIDKVDLQVVTAAGFYGWNTELPWPPPL